MEESEKEVEKLQDVKQTEIEKVIEEYTLKRIERVAEVKADYD